MNSSCLVCSRHCSLSEGQLGFCKARIAKEGRVISQNYGRITSMSLDPVEKKPFRYFHPGKMILSVGSYGCNMNCFYCQNHQISQNGEDIGYAETTPEKLVEKAIELIPKGNIGLAFTYNEPAIGWEFVYDAGRLAKDNKLSVAMVTNGCFGDEVIDKLLTVVDAFNIDLKCFTEEGYKKLGGDLETVKNTIKRAAEVAHVEITSLIVPGQNDDEKQIEEQSAWIEDISPDIPIHISRYFPCYESEIPPTSEAVMRRLAKVVGTHLNNVHLGNV